jgi:hypothetical protein
VFTNLFSFIQHPNKHLVETFWSGKYGRNEVQAGSELAGTSFAALVPSVICTAPFAQCGGVQSPAGLHWRQRCAGTVFRDSATVPICANLGIIPLVITVARCMRPLRTRRECLPCARQLRWRLPAGTSHVIRGMQLPRVACGHGPPNGRDCASGARRVVSCCVAGADRFVHWRRWTLPSLALSNLLPRPE